MTAGLTGAMVVYCGSERQISGRRESPPAECHATIDLPRMPAKISPSRDLRVGRAKTGLGLFTCVPIKKGQFIIRYRGRKIPTEITDDLNNRYMFEINTRWTIDGANRRNIARYINHSCRPNSEVYIVGHDIKIRAIKNIKADTELSYNYGRNYVDTYIKPAGGCKCHACETKRFTKRSGAAKARKAKTRNKTRSKTRKR
jgi:SET domain-containing protein